MGQVMRDPYSVLGVARGASASDIKSAFRKRAKQYHPDQNPNDPKAQERFSEINQAYEILGDSTKRAQFDAGAIDAEGKPKAQGFAHGFDKRGQGGGARGGANPFDAFSDIFGAGGPGAGAFDGRFDRRKASNADDVLSSLFGAAFNPANERRQSNKTYKPPAGKDVRINHDVSIDDVFAGKTVVALPTGQTLSVKLPGGLVSGQTIRLKGQGYPGPGGVENGDAHVTMTIRNEGGRRIEGGNLLIECAVPLDIAINGGKAPVVTPDGTLSLTVPPLSDASAVLRLRGRGPVGAGDARGDILVLIRPIFPARQHDAIAALGKTLASDSEAASAKG